MHKKSQITVFIIIVLVVLMMFGVTYYIIGSTTIREGEEEIARQQISASKIDPLKEYITSCLSLASSEGLELIGKQGGYIYKSQGGIVEDPLAGEIGKEYIDYDQTKVHYGIYAPKSNVGLVFFAQTPDYPWPTFPRLYHPITGEYMEKLEGYYGRNKLPPFNKTQENSIPEQLEEFTINSVIGCIDWASFTQQGLNITAGEANISIVFAARDVTFVLKWLMEVTDLATGAVTDINEFVVVYPVRLKKIYDFATLIMDNDVTDITYDIKASDGLITSSVMQDVFGRDDLVIIKDTDSRILDKQYEFRFMRKNRAPALYYIPEEDIEGPICNGSLIQAVPPSKLNIVDSCNQNSFELNFTAIDPDEDKPEFSYNKLLPYEIKPIDVNVGSFRINVMVSDGEYNDWQEITIPTKSG